MSQRMSVENITLGIGAVGTCMALAPGDSRIVGLHA
jgi:hypothetical protein